MANKKYEITATILVAIILAMFCYTMATAREVPVNVVDEITESINAKSDVLPVNDEINIGKDFTQAEMLSVKDDFILSEKEKSVLDKVLQDQTITNLETDDFISLINKMSSQTQKSTDENKEVAAQGKVSNTPSDVIKYLSRKRLKEL